MNWQLIIVMAVVALCLVWVFLRLFSRKKSGGCCSSGSQECCDCGKADDAGCGKK